MTGRGAEQEESKPIHGIDLGTWLQKKLENLSAAPDELDQACPEAREFASHFDVSYDIFLSIMEAAKPVFSFYMYPRRWLCLLGSRAKIYTRFVGDSAVVFWSSFSPCWRDSRSGTTVCNKHRV